MVERERRQRMEEKQKKYNEVFKVKEGDGLQQLVLDFDEKTKEAKVEVRIELESCAGVISPILIENRVSVLPTIVFFSG